MSDPADGMRVWQEARLREAVLAGDEKAWELLYVESMPGLYRFVLAQSDGRPELADDIAQESWMVAVRSMRRFDPERCRFSTWLHAIARNLLRQRREAEVRREPATGVGDLEAIGRSGPAVTDEFGSRMCQALEHLAPEERALLVDKYEHRLSLKDIAKASGRTVKAVESRLARAREALRTAWLRTD